jgi:peptidoglycan-N-acetylglucosamine deacetylase
MSRILAAAFLLFELAAVQAKAEAPKVEASGLPPLANGGVVLTFDDRNFREWIETLPLFAKYGAHATFFVSGAIDREALEAIRNLRTHGHAVGAHGVHHLRAVEYSAEHSADAYVRSEVLPQVQALKATGIVPSGFAYPNSRNNAETDAALLKVVRHLRTGSSVPSGQQISAQDSLFVPAREMATHGCLAGKGIDFAPNREDRTYEQIDGALVRAAKNKEIIVLYAHRIGTSGKENYLTPEALERVLRKALELKLAFYTFDQLP